MLFFLSKWWLNTRMVDSKLEVTLCPCNFSDMVMRLCTPFFGWN